MSIPSPSRGEKALSLFLESLRLLEKISQATSVPFLQGAVATALMIGETVQKAHRNKDECHEIGNRINTLLLGIHSQLIGKDPHSHGELRDRISSLESYLVAAHEGVIELATRNLVRRIVSCSTDEEVIAGINNQIDKALKLFELKNQVAIAMDVKHIRDETVRKRILEGSYYSGWRMANRCLPETRVQYIANILHWSITFDSPAVCWLTGVAGSGKSSIAHEVAFRHHDEGRMYSCFFFKREDERISASAIQLLAFGLSHYNTTLRLAISQAMEVLQDVRVTLSLAQQFDLFIVAPLREFSTSSSVCITLILDALDECPAGIRPDMMRALQLGVPTLPKNVKILLTSRPQGDITYYTEVLGSKCLHISVGLSQDNGDVERFIKHELIQTGTLKRLHADWSDDDVVSDAFALANKACGLFQWAAVACLLIRQRRKPRNTIERILNLKGSEDATVNLDTLYMDGLRQVFPDAEHDPDLREDYVRVVGVIIAAKEPLGVTALSDLIGLGESDISSLLIDLGCVISLEEERGTRVAHISHPSFFDFVTDKSRCRSVTFFLDLKDNSQRLERQCLEYALMKLKRDICGISSPQLDNDDVPQESREQFLSEALRYSCRFALVHVVEDPEPPTAVLHALDLFLHEKLLEWIEVMSLLEVLETAAVILRDLRVWARSVQPSPARYAHKDEMLHDGIRFLGQFGSAISRSALQTYFSALPFTPQSTLLYRTYMSKYTGIIKVTQGFHSTWPRDFLTIHLHQASDGIFFIAFSDDSSRVLVTGDGVRVFSVFTGAEIQSIESWEMTLCAMSQSCTVVAERFRDDTRAVDFKVYSRLPGSSFRTVSCQTLSRITSMAFNEAHHTFFVGFHDGTVQRWDTDTWQTAVWDISPHSTPVLTLESLGVMLASMSEEELRFIKYEANQWSLIRAVEGGRRMAFRAFSVLKWVSAVLSHSRIHITFSDTDRDTVVIPVEPIQHAITLDAKNLVSVDSLERFSIWDLELGVQLTTYTIPTFDLQYESVTAISRDGQFLAVGSLHRRVEIRALTFDTDQTPPETSQNQDVCSVTAIGGNRFVTGHTAGAVKIWESDSSVTPRIVLPSRELYSAGYTVVGLSASDDANVIAMLLFVERFEVLLRVIKRSPPTVLLEEIISATRGFTGPKLSPDCSTVLVQSAWKKGTTLHTFDLNIGVDIRPSTVVASSSFVFSPDGTLLASYGISSLDIQHLRTRSEGQSYSWEARVGRHKGPKDWSWLPRCAVARFSPDMTKIAHLCCGDGLVTVMDVEDGTVRCFERDPPPLLKGVLVQNPTTGWVFDGLGRRLWWTPPPFRSRLDSTRSCRTPPQSSDDDQLALVTPTNSLVIVDAREMIIGCSTIQTTVMREVTSHRSNS